MSEYPTRDTRTAVRDRYSVATRPRPVAASVLGIAALLLAIGAVQSLPVLLPVLAFAVALGVASYRAVRGNRRLMRFVAVSFFIYFAASLVYEGLIHLNVVMLVFGLILSGIEVGLYRRYGRGRRRA